MRILVLCMGLLFSDTASAWTLWDAYVARFVQQDGRTIDYAADDKTTSEGQAYTLFFSLVANDRATFEKVLNWANNNLARGDLGARLPAWSWGRHEGRWEVIDSNSASDADLWLAYTLFEAGRLWHVERYETLGKSLLSRIERQEVSDLPGLGPMLLPGPGGFHPDDATWRLNPSYLPFMVLRRFEAVEPGGKWGKIGENAYRMIRDSSPFHIVPDWVGYRAGQGFIADPVKGDVGSYDAIRVYLWAGMLSEKDGYRQELLQALDGMRRELRQNLVPPAVLHGGSGEATGIGPVGFSAALLPYLKVLREEKLLMIQEYRMDWNTVNSLIGANPIYYDQVLSLFGEGWMEGRFRFDESGRCLPSWK